MEHIHLDSGIKAYHIQDGGVLRFNPSDPNVYGRFLEAADKIKALEDQLVTEAKETEKNASGSDMVQLMVSADKSVKEILNWVFGNGNDFDEILGGVNLLAVAENGQQVIANLLAALEPILVAGAQRYASEKTGEAVKRAKERRENV